MSANQIMIPIAVVSLVLVIAYLVVRSRRIDAANARRDHRPNSPNTGHDKAEIARSAMSGMMGLDR